MSYANIDSVKKCVIECLKNNPTTRDSDDYLYIMVCEKIAPQTMTMPFPRVLLHRDEFKLPTFESVSRARRKAQEEDWSLKGSESIEQGRAEAEEFMREWAIQ